VRYTQRDRIVAQPLPPALTLPARSQIGHVLRWLSLSSLPSSRALGTRSGSRLGAGAPCLPVSSRRTLGQFSWSVCPGRGSASAPVEMRTVAAQRSCNRIRPTEAVSSKRRPPDPEPTSPGAASLCCAGLRVGRTGATFALSAQCTSQKRRNSKQILACWQVLAK
jgi:hypothetical protein